MRRSIVHTAAMAGAALLLVGCGFADIHAPVPEFMRTKAVDPPPEPPPDVRELVRKHLDTVFTAASNPRQVRVSPPLHAPYGSGWTSCIRADLTSVNGRPLGAETYRITISAGVIIDRRRAEADDNCASESYEPI